MTRRVSYIPPPYNKQHTKQADWVAPYLGHSSLNKKWYGVLGNHEYGYNVQAVLDISKQYPNWVMPARYFSERVLVSGTTYMTMIFIDTSPYVGGRNTAAVGVRGVCVWGVCVGVRPVSGKGGEPTWLQLLFVVCAEEEQEEGEQRGMRVLCVGNGRARVVRVWRGGVGGVGHALRCLYMPYHLPLSQP